MDDRTITKLCAQAMGCTDTLDTVWDSRAKPPVPHMLYRLDGQWRNFDPLHDDAQAMALVKKFGLMLTQDIVPAEWRAEANNFVGRSPDLNRAICECIAQMMKAKSAA